MFFGKISGSAPADTSAVGSTLIPDMVREGYPKSFSGAVTAASSTVGSITPPSIIMLIQAMVMNESVGALFMVGVIPGILVGAVEMVYTHFSSTRNHYPRRTEPVSFREFLTAFTFSAILVSSAKACHYFRVSEKEVRLSDLESGLRRSMKKRLQAVSNV